MSKNWETSIGPDSKGGPLRELLHYRDLIILLVKRDFVSLYKQTILGPIWVVAQPIMMTIIFTIVFNRIAAIDTGVPPVLFYLLNISIWTYFSDGVLKTSETFIANQNVFGKVYFPRLAVPLSIVITNMIKFAIQFALFLLVYLYFIFAFDMQFDFNWRVCLVPLFLVIMVCLGLGTGLIIAGLTTKYRDLRFLIQFGIQLLMYATPVVYPLSKVPADYRWILFCNPMTSVIETFKAVFFGADQAVLSWFYLGYSLVVSLLVLWLGIALFRRVERSFMDTI